MKNYNFMVRLASLLLILFITKSGVAQNIFDSISSQKYAQFLFSNQEYKLAHQEYERVLFLTNSQDDSLKWLCVKSLRLSGEPSLANRRILTFYPNKDFRSSLLSKEYMKTLFELKRYDQIESELPIIHPLDSNDRLFFLLSSLYLSREYTKADALIDKTVKPNTVVDIFTPVQKFQKDLNFKSPFLAGSMSAVIPGLGQTYAGNWKDGLFSLIFTGSAAFQSYRGFHKTGITSTYGWVYGILSSVFYSANIYGAVKATNKYNYLNHVKISIQVGGVMDNYNP
jgi:hypothetical protein